MTPFWPTNSPQQHRVTGFTGFGSTIRIGFAHRVNGAATHHNVGKGKGVTEFGPHRFHNFNGFANHFRSDSVTADQRNFVIHLPSPLAFKELSRPPLWMIPLMNSGKGAAW